MEERRVGDTKWCDIACVIAILYTIGYFLLVWKLMSSAIPTENKDIVNALIGILSVIQSGIVQYYFGGSKSADVSQRAAIDGRAKADAAIQTVATAPTVLVSKQIGDTDVTKITS